MTKNVVVLDAQSQPLGETYVRRAKQLVKNGRAKWFDENTLLLTALAPPPETEDIQMQNTREEWVDYFKNLTEQLLVSDELTAKAIQAFANMETGPNSPDCPGEALGKMMESHLRFKETMCKNLMDFVSDHILSTEVAQ